MTELASYKAALLASDRAWHAYVRACTAGDKAACERLDVERQHLAQAVRDAGRALDRALLAEAKAEARPEGDPHAS